MSALPLKALGGAVLFRPHVARPTRPVRRAGLEVASPPDGNGYGRAARATAKAIAALPVLLKTLTDMATLCVCRCGESWTSRDMHGLRVADIGDLRARSTEGGGATTRPPATNRRGISIRHSAATMPSAPPNIVSGRKKPVARGPHLHPSSPRCRRRQHGATPVGLVSLQNIASGRKKPMSPAAGGFARRFAATQQRARGVPALMVRAVRRHASSARPSASSLPAIAEREHGEAAETLEDARQRPFCALVARGGGGGRGAPRPPLLAEDRARGGSARQRSLQLLGPENRTPTSGRRWSASGTNSSSGRRQLHSNHCRSPTSQVMPRARRVDAYATNETFRPRSHGTAWRSTTPKALAHQPQVIAVGGTTEWKWRTAEENSRRIPSPPAALQPARPPGELGAMGVESTHDGTSWSRGGREADGWP